MRMEEIWKMLYEKSSNLEKLEDNMEHLFYYGDKNDIWNRKEESG